MDKEKKDAEKYNQIREAKTLKYKGFTNAEIAAQLNISENSVRICLATDLTLMQKGTGKTIKI